MMSHQGADDCDHLLVAQCRQMCQTPNSSAICFLISLSANSGVVHTAPAPFTRCHGPSMASIQPTRQRSLHDLRTECGASSCCVLFCCHEVLCCSVCHRANNPNLHTNPLLLAKCFSCWEHLQVLPDRTVLQMQSFNG